MNPISYITSSFNETLALSELAENCFLGFSILLLLYIFKKKNIKSGVLKAFSFTLVTMVCVFIAWSITKPLGKTGFAVSYINPIPAIFDAIIGKYTFYINNPYTKVYDPKFIQYIFGYQILGMIMGFIIFFVCYFIMKNIKNSYFKDDQPIKIKDFIFDNTVEKYQGFFFKEMLFIFAFSITIPLTPRIDRVVSGITSGFSFVIMNMLILFLILFISSFFNFYTFHIFLGLGFAIVKIILTLIDLTKKQIQVKDFFRISGKSLGYTATTWALSIAWPIIIAFVTIAILKNSGDQTYAY